MGATTNNPSTTAKPSSSNASGSSASTPNYRVFHRFASRHRPASNPRPSATIRLATSGSDAHCASATNAHHSSSNTSDRSRWSRRARRKLSISAKPANPHCAARRNRNLCGRPTDLRVQQHSSVHHQMRGTRRLQRVDANMRRRSRVYHRVHGHCFVRGHHHQWSHWQGFHVELCRSWFLRG